MYIFVVPIRYRVPICMGTVLQGYIYCSAHVAVAMAQYRQGYQ